MLHDIFMLIILYINISEEALRTLTEGGHNYNTSWLSILGRDYHKLFTFHVKVCKQAKLLFASIPKQTNILNYEIVIGKFLILSSLSRCFSSK